jgi:hypothetical protein
MAKEFIIKTHEDWCAVVRLASPFVGKKPFRLTLHKGLKRTIDQNKLLHAFCADCAERYWAKFGKSLPAAWWKREIKAKLGKKAVHFDLDDQPTIFIESTTEYDTAEMSALLQKAQAFLKIEHEIDVPLPEDK